MKTIFAKEKSEYSHCMWKCIEINTSKKERQENYIRLQQIEKFLKSQNDEIMVIVTTKNTKGFNVARPMSMENIKNGSS